MKIKILKLPLISEHLSEKQHNTTERPTLKTLFYLEVIISKAF